MAENEIEFFADKIFVHRWPHDPPLWGETTKKELDESINKNTRPKKVIVKGKKIQIENFEFTSLKKVGISVPFFKDECRMIFEAKFGNLFAHVHITMKDDNFLDVFNELILWRRNEF